MPKTKRTVGEENKDENREILLDDEEKVLDPDVVDGELLDVDGEDDDGLDLDEEVDPFKDKWEE